VTICPRLGNRLRFDKPPGPVLNKTGMRLVTSKVAESSVPGGRKRLERQGPKHRRITPATSRPIGSFQAPQCRQQYAMFLRPIRTTSSLTGLPATSVSSATVPSRLIRGFASASSPIHSLLLIEHRSGQVEGGTLAALTAASELGGKVTGLVFGALEEVEGVVQKVKKSV